MNAFVVAAINMAFIFHTSYIWKYVLVTS